MHTIPGKLPPEPQGAGDRRAPAALRCLSARGSAPRRTVNTGNGRIPPARVQAGSWATLCGRGSGSWLTVIPVARGHSELVSGFPRSWRSAAINRLITARGRRVCSARAITQELNTGITMFNAAFRATNTSKAS